MTTAEMAAFYGGKAEGIRLALSKLPLDAMKELRSAEDMASRLNSEILNRPKKARK